MNNEKILDTINEAIENIKLEGAVENLKSDNASTDYSRELHRMSAWFLHQSLSSLIKSRHAFRAYIDN